MAPGHRGLGFTSRQGTVAAGGRKAQRFGPWPLAAQQRQQSQGSQGLPLEDPSEKDLERLL